LRREAGRSITAHRCDRRTPDTAMNCLPEYGPAPRRSSVAVEIAHVRMGGDAPVVVQSMTNTDTADVSSTVQQVAALARAGSELVRVTANNDAAAKGVPHIVEQLDKQGIKVPIIGDFHYNGHLLLKKYPDCTK